MPSRKTTNMKILPLIILVLLLTACKTNEIAVVKLNSKFGCINRKGETIIPFTWDWLIQSHNSKYLLAKKDSLYGFINKKGVIIIQPKYKDANLFSEGLAPVSNGIKFGFIDKKDNIVIPFIYDNIFLGFSHNLSDVEKHDSCGYINRKGKIVIPLIYDTCYPFLSQVADVRTFDNQTLIVNRKGETFPYDKSKYQNTRLWGLNNYPGSFTIQTGQGRLTSRGDTVVPPIYSATGNLSNGMYIVKLQNKWGAYNTRGILSVPIIFDNLGYFHESLANFRQCSKWGYTNKNGEIIIQIKFDYAKEFYHNLTYVEINNKVGFINKKGSFVIAPNYDIYRLGSFN